MSARRVAAVIGVLAIAVVAALGLGPRAISMFGASSPTVESSDVARWIPLLSSEPVTVALPPAPAAGSPDDAGELLAIRTLQAARPEPGASVAWSSEPVQRWNAYLLEVIRKEKPNPVRASRALALLNAALYDATIAATAAKLSAARAAPATRDGTIRQLLAPEPVSSYPSSGAALAAAAGTILTLLYPARTDEIAANVREALEAPLVVGIGATSDVDAGAAIGRAVGALAVERAQSDGAAPPPQPGAPPIALPEFPGAWRPQIAGIRTVEPAAGTWRPWLMPSGDAFRPPPPPAFGSPEWQRDAAELVDTIEHLAPDQLEVARFWADGGGTDTPAGHWTRIALELTVRDRLPQPLAARALAHLSLAQADAFIACWDAKYAYWTGRPFQLIPNFASAIVTPNFPSFPSGHSTQSAAAALVLGAFFPSDAERLRAMALEAAESRILGGIHYRHDNVAGIEMGRRIGALAVERLDRS